MQFAKETNLASNADRASGSARGPRLRPPAILFLDVSNGLLQGTNGVFALPVVSQYGRVQT